MKYGLIWAEEFCDNRSRETDPRVHVSDADLAAQLKLDIDVESTLGDATRLQRQMNGLRSQLESARNRGCTKARASNGSVEQY